MPKPDADAPLGDLKAPLSIRARDLRRALGLAILVLGVLAAAGFAGVVAAFTIRGGALYFGWTFPTYKRRPGRHPDEVM